MPELSPRIIADIAEIPPARCNALVDNNPTVSHAYLHALQQSGCATAPYGWQAQHLTLWDGADLRGIMPLYIKTNSVGEHVFDWAWADAYHRHGLHYFPKLVCCIPYTPVTGPRLLATSSDVRTQLLDHALKFARELGVSSLHCLFLEPADVEAATQAGMMLRHDVQFHWQNQGYKDFEDFLSDLSRDKRKRIRQERRKIRDAGLELRCITGNEATEEDWAFFASCYAHTRRIHHSPPALNDDFFHRIGATILQNTLLIIARREGKKIASALTLYNSEVMYGRSWGTFEFHSGLHFETCYYQAIEFCIAHGIKTFEGGAQGEHKLARGFMPVTTTSAHWLAHPEFSHAVERYLQQETSAISGYVDELNEHSPFKRG
jgi:predicted N-acyltransferase